MSIFPNVGLNFSSWSPTVTCSGAMTIGAVVINSANFALTTDACFFQFDISGTLGGVAATQILVSPPVTINNAILVPSVANIIQGGAAFVGRAGTAFPNIAVIRNNDAGDLNYALAGVRVLCAGFFLT